jgi:uncharacterized protein (DUF488 family)
MRWDGIHLFSVGHSTRPWADFVRLLSRHGIRTLVDVRRFPRSRRHPHFDGRAMAAALSEAGIAYRSLEGLGGRRPGLGAGSPNTGWRDPGFRGYADHLRTAEFLEGLERLRESASQAPTAVMCAEALFWRCHRQLIADAVVARGGQVIHLVSEQEATPHVLTPFARLDGEVLTYLDPEAMEQLRLPIATGAEPPAGVTRSAARRSGRAARPSAPRKGRRPRRPGR